MSFKSFGFAVLSHLILLAVGFFIGRYTAPEPKLPSFEPREAKVDTVIRWKDSEAQIVSKDEPAIINPKQPEIYRSILDTIAVIGEDSIDVLQSITFNDSTKTFGSILNIKMRKMERTIIDSIFVPQIIEVPADQPFYDTFWFGSVFSIIAVLLIAIFL
jgi:hypothetical protein